MPATPLPLVRAGSEGTPSDGTLDAFVVQMAPSLLAADRTSTGCVRGGGTPRLGTGGDCDAPRVGPGRRLARYWVLRDGDPAPPDGSDDGDPLYVIRPSLVEARHPVDAGPGRTARYPGLHCPALCQAVHTLVLQAAPGLLRDSVAAGTELAGLVVRRRPAGRPSLTRFAGHAEALSVAPHCNGRRGVRGELDPQLEELLAEYHVHPNVPGTHFAPPSYADLYQLMLAAAKGEHNCSFVVAPEGVYACSMAVDDSQRVLEEVRVFLRVNRYDEGASEGAIQLCEQPRLDLAARLRDQIPHLWALLHEPAQEYKALERAALDAPGQRPCPAESARTFCQRVGSLGLRVQFLPL